MRVCVCGWESASCLPHMHPHYINIIVFVICNVSTTVTTARNNKLRQRAKQQKKIIKKLAKTSSHHTTLQLPTLRIEAGNKNAYEQTALSNEYSQQSASRSHNNSNNTNNSKNDGSIQQPPSTITAGCTQLLL